MSYATITQATWDLALRGRVAAAVQREALNGSGQGTAFGVGALSDAVWATERMMYPVAIDTEAAYESALLNGNPNPGGDPAVITDGNILSAVQAHWPPDPLVAETP